MPTVYNTVCPPYPPGWYARGTLPPSYLSSMPGGTTPTIPPLACQEVQHPPWEKGYTLRRGGYPPWEERLHSAQRGNHPKEERLHSAQRGTHPRERLHSEQRGTTLGRRRGSAQRGTTLPKEEKRLSAQSSPPS